MKTNNIITENGYTVEQTISGYFRLMRGETIIFDDSACEDCYDEDSATAMFADYLVNEAHGVFTLDGLADYINNHDNSPLEVSEIIAANGWTDETGQTFGVASDGEQCVMLDDNGEAYVADED